MSATAPAGAMDDGVSNARPATECDSGSGSRLPSINTSRSPKTSKGMGTRGGWEANYFTSASMDSLPGTAGTGRVVRRYNFGNTARSRDGLDKRLPQLSHFDVRLDKLTFAGKHCVP